MAQLVRVLHVLPRLSMGGVTSWITRVIRNMDPSRFHFDFATHRPSCGPYVGELSGLGCRVLQLPDRRRIVAYLAALRNVIRDSGPYRVVHSHYHFFNGVVMAIAAWEGVPMRIAHAQTTSHLHPLRLRESARASPCRMLLKWYATHYLACSSAAAHALFGRDLGTLILPGGFNVKEFHRDYSTVVMREKLGIPNSAFVVGHVGNFVKAKNHSFLLDVFALIARRRPDSLLVLVGDGELRAALSRKAASLGLERRIRYLGFRQDVAEILPIFDVFVFPSLWEGLPIALVEAQAAGVPALASDSITREVSVSPAIRFLPLRNPSVWAEHALELGSYPRTNPDTSDERLARFTLEYHIRELERLYTSAVDKLCPSRAL